MARSMSPPTSCDASPPARARSAAAANAPAAAANSASMFPPAGDASPVMLRAVLAGAEHVARPWAGPLDLQVEHPGRVEAEDVALRLLAEERNRRDRIRRVEVPVRPVGRVQ